MGVGTLWKESSTDARWTLSEQEELEEADWKLSIPISSPTFIFLLQFGGAWSTAAMDLAVLSNVTAERGQGWMQKQFTRLELTSTPLLSLNTARDERERDLARFGLSRYFLSPAQWNIIWGDKAGITHNFLVFSPEQHSQQARGVSTHV